MHKRILIYLGLFFIAWSLKAQPNVRIQSSADFMAVDLQGNVFLVDNANITKYSRQGERLFNYGNALWGAISSVDVTDPLRILLFFKESNTIIFLNHQLAEIGDPIDLGMISDAEALVASYAAGGGFWVFDAIGMSLNHFDKNGVVLAKTDNLSSLLESQIPISLTEHQQNLYLQLPNRVVIFDAYGGYLKNWPIESSNTVRIYNQTYQVFKDSILVEGGLELLRLNERTMNLGNEVQDAVLLHKHLYLMYKDSVLIKALNNK